MGSKNNNKLNQIKTIFNNHKNTYVLLIIFLALLVILFLLFGLLKKSNSKILYVNSIYNESYSYPYFNSIIIDKDIKDYISNIDINNIKETSYKINSFNNFISILFTNTDINGNKTFNAFNYDYNSNKVLINDVIPDLDLLKDRIMTYAINNNITLPTDFSVTALVYYFDIESLDVILDNNIIKIDYNEFDNNILLKYNKKEDFTKMTTTATTTTTTTTTTTNNPPISKTEEEPTGPKYIAFTFDDGPSKYTLDIVNILDSYGFKATFFEVGNMISGRADIVNEVLNRGFEIGNHTFDHSNLNKLSQEAIKTKLQSNNDLFKSYTGKDMMLIRPPYGSCNTNCKSVINLPIIKWSVDSRDWESKNVDKILSVVKSNTKDGDIVLFHDLYKTTKESIELLVPYFKDKGYTIVSVSELFKIKGKTLENGSVYFRAR